MLSRDGLYEKVKEWLNDNIFESNTCGYDDYNEVLDYYAIEFTNNLIDDWHYVARSRLFEEDFKDVVDDYALEFKKHSDHTAAKNIKEKLIPFVKAISKEL